jgi:hypothetical protein
VTANLYSIRSSVSTTANSGTPYTIPNVSGYVAEQGTFNADSTVGVQFGFHATSSITGATNNYGFVGNIAAGVTRTITNVELTSNVVTVTTSVAHGYLAGQSVTVAATTNTAINGTYTIASVPTTTTFTYARTSADIASIADTGTTVIVGRYNFYASGTAPNYFNGQILIGATQAYTPVAGRLAPIEVNATATTTDAATFTKWSNTVNSLDMTFSRSRGAVGVQTVMNSGDVISNLSFRGSDGASFVPAAVIIAAVDGTPGAGDMPGRLTFATTADGAATPTERMRIDSAGQVGIGATTTLGTTLRVSKNITGAASASGAIFGGAAQSDVTTTAFYVQTFGSTAAASFTLGTMAHFFANQGTIGAGSSVTNQHGFWANSSLTGATNNFGFRGDIAAGTGRWNFYAAGTADNYFKGNVGLDTTTPTQKLDINDDSIRVRTAKTPASATATGTQGQIAWDADYVYVCVATDTWKRTALLTWI